MASMSTTTLWNPLTHQEYETLKGFDVYTSDDEKLGTIREIFHPVTAMPTARGSHVFRVEPGALKKLFSDQDEVYVPERLISRVDLDAERVFLALPKASLSQQDW